MEGAPNISYSITYQLPGGDKQTNSASNSTVLSSLSPGTFYNITVETIGPQNFRSLPVTVSAYTQPSAVTNLRITEVTTSSVTLNWTAPDGGATSYILRWTGEGHTINETTTETTFTLKDLIPGSRYYMTVAAVAGEILNEGEQTSITAFTKPERPVDIQVTKRGTAHLSITWTLPSGRADYYQVNVSNVDQTYSSSNTAANLTALHPGRVFDVTVTAVAGNLSSTSDTFSFATIPTPPGSISVSERTTTSLHLQWETPDRMEGAPNISYSITYQLPGGDKQTNSASNSAVLSSLSPGTFYNITVETIGPQNFRSLPVTVSAYTLPNPVLNIIASPSNTTSIKVEWSYPQDVQPYYTYMILTYNTTGSLVKNQTVSDNNTDVQELEPGTRYDITVTTIAAEGSQSTVERTFSYTMPEAVTELNKTYVNTTVIQLRWRRQDDHKASYSYLLILLQDAEMIQNVSTKTENYTFSNLIPGKQYRIEVFTVVDSVKSSVKSTLVYTMPEVVSGVVTVGSTTNMSVTWSPALGQVDSYSVQLSRDSQTISSNKNLNNTTVKTVFKGLTPGVRYCVVVTTESGPEENHSPEVCDATIPNPPGPITVDFQTMESINFTWPPPDDMDHNQYNFSVSSIKVGLLGYESTSVIAENYTKPEPVTQLQQTEITTNTVTLVWKHLVSKFSDSYLVQVTNASVSWSYIVFNTTHTVPGLLSGSNYSFTVSTRTPDGTLAAPLTKSYFTRPYTINNLMGETLNSTAVRLDWLKPLEYKSEYKYKIETTGFRPESTTLAKEVAQISELTPGTNYTFCVTVRAEDGTEGGATCISQYTKPEVVQPSVSSHSSNSSILVSWPDPPGHVEYYTVHVNISSTVVEQYEINNTNNSLLVENLSAGRLYAAMVTSHSGPFNVSSEFVANATFPNPPGPIEILMKTTSSIDITWSEAPLMTGASFSYQLTNTPSQEGGYISTKSNSYNFTSLQSGTSYNISVATVGAMGFKSDTVHSYLVTTRPLSAEFTDISTEEENITVRWTEPDDYQESYRYNLTWQRSYWGIPDSIVTSNTEYVIDGLIPGSSYNLSITTETSDGTQADLRWISNCTNASPVKNLTCEGPNHADAEINISWIKPRGQYHSLQITAKNMEIVNITSSCTPRCSYTISDLSHHTEYRLRVETLSCGRPSTAVSLPCWTGITDPPIPENFTSLVTVDQKAHDRFSIQINSSLLVNTSGPITHFGVLVANSLSGVNTSNLSKYLGKTYKQWSEKATPVYLATVRERNVQSRSKEDHLLIDIGDGSTWEGYTNGALHAKGKYQYAIVLFTQMSLENKLVNDQRSLFSTTYFYPPIELPPNIVVIALAVGASLGIFCILFIILIGFIIYWKRISHKESSDIHIHSMRNAAVRVEDYEVYYKKQRADSNCGFAEEFEDLRLVGTGQSKTHAQNQENKPKNRYNNVLPYDSSRVRLSIIHGSPYDDYINANYMPGYNSRKEFIAAQGPLPGTVSEFWRMIWEKNVQTLVMLTRCNEQGRVKCEQYWHSGMKHFEYITVTTTSEIPLDDWTIRDFDIKNVKTAETRSVRHFHFTAWPDHGVPETPELLISFRHLVREHMDQYSRNSPTVVHCSAGVGRTGTFIAIDHLIFQIERENIVDVYGIVHDLRMHRPLMVQTEDQYVFLNQCAMDIIRSRTGTNVDLIYQNTAALSIYENVEPKKGFHNNGYRT
ncbi:receptor-type tyrosine-protein phosphatase eta-like [Aulostomus maculatus]